MEPESGPKGQVEWYREVMDPVSAADAELGFLYIRRSCGAAGEGWHLEKRVVSCIVSNQPGVLYRISGLLSRRGYNIDSITVGTTMDYQLSRMTIVVQADDRTLEQVVKQLKKIIDVKKVRMLHLNESTLGELVLIKVSVNDGNRKAVVDMANGLHANIVDIGRDTATIQVVGSSADVDTALALFETFGLEELARTGLVALERGDGSLEKYRSEFEDE